MTDPFGFCTTYRAEPPLKCRGCGAFSTMGCMLSNPEKDCLLKMAIEDSYREIDEGNDFEIKEP